jgi:hypothetical protein
VIGELGKQKFYGLWGNDVTEDKLEDQTSTSGAPDEFLMLRKLTIGETGVSDNNWWKNAPKKWI